MRKQKSVSISGIIILLIILINVLIIKVSYIGNVNWYYALILTLPLLVLAQAYKIISENKRTNNSQIRRNIGRKQKFEKSKKQYHLLQN